MVYIKNETNNDGPLLEVRDLVTRFRQKFGEDFNVVDGIDITVNFGEIHGIVGESGSGKTITALSVLNLLPGAGAVASGKIFWKKRDLLSLSRKEIQAIRGAGIAMISQNPQQALNPLYTAGQQLLDVIRLHNKHLNKSKVQARAMAWLDEVGLSNPDQVMSKYPHELSGGMCQRVVIAMVLACRPKLLIADEPTAALDVTIQSQIIELLLKLRDKYRMAVLFISHDLGVIAQLCDRVSVMYLGKIIETGSVDAIFTNALHPYTQGLLKAIPIPDPSRRNGKIAIKGDIPLIGKFGQECRFAGRCPKVFKKCREQEPLLEIHEDSQVACWLYQKAEVAF